MHTLVLLRHGESDWNKENRFTGWTDVDLSEKGIVEQKEGWTYQLHPREGAAADFSSLIRGKSPRPGIRARIVRNQCTHPG